jgi:spore coat polysaccharide biosynthesis predicted glycosyltransferase SpsG/RimJ/RimL family protein N-acetyltransferase
MKALFLTEGGKKIGFGHITRCLALAQGFRQHGITSEFLINADLSAKQVFRGERFACKMLDWSKKYKQLKISLRKADLVIIDSYLAQGKQYDFIYQTLSQDSHAHQLVCIDDNNRLFYPPAIIVNPSIGAEGIRYRKRDRPDRHQFLLGQDFSILRKPFWNIPDKKINARVKNILVTCGGMDNKSFLNKLITRLVNRFPESSFHIVSAHCGCQIAKLPGVRVYTNRTGLQMLELMLKCDLCVSGAGQTLYELARVGVPTVSVLFADNQRFQVLAFSKRKFLEYVGSYKRKDELGWIERSLQKLLSQGQRRQKYAIGRALIDGRGVGRIVCFCLKQYLTKVDRQIFLRCASKIDCLSLWQWRNHPEVRKWSFDARTIPYSEHRAWFGRKSNDKKVNIYIAHNSESEKFGQVRFEFNGNHAASINVNLNPRFIGQGMGNKIIRLSTQTYFKNHASVRQVIAEVRRGNVRSAKAFRKAGYTFCGRTSRYCKPVSLFKIERYSHG